MRLFPIAGGEEDPALRDAAAAAARGVKDVPVGLGERVLVEIYRGHRGYYAAEPDVRREYTGAPEDLIPTAGRVYLAKRINAGDLVVSAMAYMAVGTVSTAPALGDTTLTGEVKRKALAIGSCLAGDQNWTAVCTFGGAADTLTGVNLQEAGIMNHASSGQGTMFQRVLIGATTLQDSDLVKVSLVTNVGSN